MHEYALIEISKELMNIITSILRNLNLKMK